MLMNLIDILLVAVIGGIIGAGLWYIRRAKKKGIKCIGCPDAPKCAGNCSGCPGNCGSCTASRSKQ